MGNVGNLGLSYAAERQECWVQGEKVGAGPDSLRGSILSDSVSVNNAKCAYRHIR